MARTIFFSDFEVFEKQNCVYCDRTNFLPSNVLNWDSIRMASGPYHHLFKWPILNMHSSRNTGVCMLETLLIHLMDILEAGRWQRYYENITISEIWISSQWNIVKDEKLV